MPDLLRDRDDSHARTLQPSTVMLEQVVVAKQPRKTVDADLGNFTAGPHHMLEQRLKATPIVVVPENLPPR